MSADQNIPGFPPVPPGDPARPLFDDPPESSNLSDSDPPERFDWRKNVVLFLLTVVSVFYVGAGWTGPEATRGLQWLAGWQFAVPLLVILLFHEFGHYIAARLHRVPASLPYFLPAPVLSPFGTLGAIIVMPKRIRSSNALLDIGAAGPLAGMVAAVPIMLYGLSQSALGPRGAEGSWQEGQSLLYFALKYLTFGPIPMNQDVQLHPTAFAAWAGFFVTFLNLIPFGQLDGGHVAYALLGERHHRLARFIFFVPLVLFVYNFVVHALPVLRRAFAEGFGSLPGQAWLPVSSSLGQWIVLSILLIVMRRYVGFKHPPVDADDKPLSLTRKCVAVFTLALFGLLFMPTPLLLL